MQEWNLPETSQLNAFEITWTKDQFFPQNDISGKKVLLKIHYIIPAEDCEWSLAMIYFNTKKKAL